MLKEGDKAPLFKTVTDKDEPFDLADHQKGTVVLYFYPRADTPGCTIEACEFRDSFDRVHVTSTDGNAMGFLAAGIDQVLDLARQRGVALPSRTGSK